MWSCTATVLIQYLALTVENNLVWDLRLSTEMLEVEERESPQCQYDHRDPLNSFPATLKMDQNGLRMTETEANKANSGTNVDFLNSKQKTI